MLRKAIVLQLTFLKGLITCRSDFGIYLEVYIKISLGLVKIPAACIGAPEREAWLFLSPASSHPGC